MSLCRSTNHTRLGTGGVGKERSRFTSYAKITQMTVHNQAGVQFLAQQGFKRVVVSRKIALADIEAICHTTDTEIEGYLFHGALCISYSGQYLISSMISGQAATEAVVRNRVVCHYKLQDKQGNDLLADVRQVIIY